MKRNNVFFLKTTRLFRMGIWLQHVPWPCVENTTCAYSRALREGYKTVKRGHGVRDRHWNPGIQHDLSTCCQMHTHAIRDRAIIVETISLRISIKPHRCQASPAADQLKGNAYNVENYQQFTTLCHSCKTNPMPWNNDPTTSSERELWELKVRFDQGKMTNTQENVNICFSIPGRSGRHGNPNMKRWQNVDFPLGFPRIKGSTITLSCKCRIIMTWSRTCSLLEP